MFAFAKAYMGMKQVLSGARIQRLDMSRMVTELCKLPGAQKRGLGWIQIWVSSKK